MSHWNNERLTTILLEVIIAVSVICFFTLIFNPFSLVHSCEPTGPIPISGFEKESDRLVSRARNIIHVKKEREFLEKEARHDLIEEMRNSFDEMNTCLFDLAPEKVVSYPVNLKDSTDELAILMETNIGLYENLTAITDEEISKSPSLYQDSFLDPADSSEGNSEGNSVSSTDTPTPDPVVEPKKPLPMEQPAIPEPQCRVIKIPGKHGKVMLKVFPGEESLSFMHCKNLLMTVLFAKEKGILMPEMDYSHWTVDALESIGEPLNYGEPGEKRVHGAKKLGRKLGF